jgi:hypothetical protein
MRSRKLKPRLSGFLADDAAAALTEFAIVIPLVLIVFFAMLQYVMVFRASQLGNYAAYAAARSYAVHAAVAGEDAARETALDAAAMALSPIAPLVPGELRGIGLRLTRIDQGLLALGEGFVIARYVRLNPWFGGSLNISTEGSGNLLQVNVEINYPQPIYIPGLAELWGLVGNPSDIHRDLRPLSEGLGGITGAPNWAGQWAGLQVSQALPEWFQFLFPGAAQSLVNAATGLVGDAVDVGKNILLPFPYVNVRSKCSIGYEDWGSQDPEYRPRHRKTVGSGAQSAADRLENAQLENKGEESQQLGDDLKAGKEQEQQRCQQWQAAVQRREAAEQDYNNTPDDPPEAKQAAYQALQSARNAEANAQSAYSAAWSRLQNAIGRIEQATGQSYPSGSRCQP